MHSVVVVCCAAKDQEGQGEERGEEDGRETADGSTRPERQVKREREGERRKREEEERERGGEREGDREIMGMLYQLGNVSQWYVVMCIVQGEAEEEEEKVGQLHPLR